MVPYLYKGKPRVWLHVKGHKPNKPKRHRWTTDEMEKLAKWDEEGRTNQFIAKKLKLSPGAIEQRRYIMRRKLQNTLRGAELEQIFGVSRYKILRWCKLGLLPAQKYDKMYRVKYEDVENFLRNPATWGLWSLETLQGEMWRVIAEEARTDNYLSIKKAETKYPYEGSWIAELLRRGVLRGLRCPSHRMRWYVSEKSLAAYLDSQASGRLQSSQRPNLHI